MSGMLSGRSIFGNQPNVLFDASNYGRGQNDALAIQKNRLMLDRAQMENANDQAFRSAAPGAIGGDPAAMTAAVQADPDRALALQSQLAGLDSGRRKKALESMTILGQGAASLLSLPDDQAAAARLHPPYTSLGRPLAAVDRGWHAQRKSSPSRPMPAPRRPVGLPAPGRRARPCGDEARDFIRLPAHPDGMNSRAIPPPLAHRRILRHRATLRGLRVVSG